jgi:hypothetical protein
MYDMYPWDSASQGDYPPQPLRSVRNPARRAPKPRNGSAPGGSALSASAPNGSARNGSGLNGHARDITAAQAVQIALDRRDNGGDAATPPAATPPAVRPAIQAATRPAASQARQ